MRFRLAATLAAATVIAAAQPRLQTPVTPETGAQPGGLTTPPPVGEIIRRAVARAAAQDEDKPELRFESLVTTTVESLNDEAEVRSTETTLHRRYALEGAVYEELIERDGEPLNESDVRDEAKRRADFRREAQEAEAGGHVLETNDERQVRFDEDLMARYDAEVVGEETVRGERCWVINFTPRTDELPHDTRIDRVLNQSSGELYVSQNDYGVMQIDFRLLRPVRYVWGLVASLSRATGQLEFDRVKPEIWLPSRFDVRIDLRVFFVTKRRHIVRRWIERHRVEGDAG